MPLGFFHAFWMIGLVATLLAQAPDTSVRAIREVELAAAEWAANRWGHKTFGIDTGLPRGFWTHRPTGPASVSHRDTLHQRALATRSRARILPDSGAPPLCSPDGPRPCLEGILRVEVPTIRGDSATVWVYFWIGWGLPPCCRNWDEEAFHLLFAREGGRWRMKGIIAGRMT